MSQNGARIVYPRAHFSFCVCLLCVQDMVILREKPTAPRHCAPSQKFGAAQQKPNEKHLFSVVPGPKFHPKSAPNRFKISFRGVLGPQERPQTPRDPSQDPPRTPRDPPGTPPGPPGTPSRRPQGPPGTAQDPPKDSPRAPGASREAPRSPPGRPREPPGSPPGPPGTPQEPPRPPPDLRDPPRPFQNC